MLSSAASIAVTLAPIAASDSDKIPPPHPTSTTDRDSRGLLCSALRP